MKLFKVWRPFCDPGIALVVAKNNRSAKRLANKRYGYCDNMQAKVIKQESEKVIALY